MPIDRLALILVCVAVAAGITVWVATFVSAAIAYPVPGLIVVMPAAMLVWIVWRVVAQRLRNPEDDHYDRIEK